MEKTFGDIIKEKRLNKGFSQTELAKKAGISVAEVCRIEKDERKNPSMKLSVNLLKALDVEKDEFAEIVGF